MKFELVRLNKAGIGVSYTGVLYLSDGCFSFIFDEPTKEIGLNDNNFHSMESLYGEGGKISIDKVGVYIGGCYVRINGKYHRDGFAFRFISKK